MITCKEYTDLRKKELKEYIKEKGLRPTLVVIQVGDRPESNSYIRGKMRDCEEVGIDIIVEKKEEWYPQWELEIAIRTYNAEPDIHGIILQLPVPDHIDVKRIQELIKPEKDVDGFGKISQFDPCTPKGVIDYLRCVGVSLIYSGPDVIDIGLGVSEDGKLRGNLNKNAIDFIKEQFPNNICISGKGGVGLLTRLALLENVVKACEMQKGKKYEY